MKIKTSRLLQSAGILFLSCLLSSVTYGQTGETFVKKIYMQGGAGWASHNGAAGEISIQSVLKHNWVATFSYHHVEAEPKNLPNDYQPDVFILIPINQTPAVKMELFSFTGGKYFATGRNTWMTTEAGITFGSSEKMTFTPTDPQFFIIGATSNYDDKTEKKSLTGLMLKADYNWAFASFMGLGAEIFANINSVQSPVGVNIKLFVGKTGRVRKHKQ
ncbi:MAG TPA: hypothetical protein VJ765_11450 [Chitinophagaceae bacterium]|nr:hypothetical protein [Chitinophagaceae bacterium]